MPMVRSSKTSSSVKNKGKELVVVLEDIVCFKCHGIRHMNDKCPNANSFTSEE